MFSFLRRIVLFDGLGLDDDTGVAFLVVLALVRNGPDNIARSEADSNAKGQDAE